MTLSSAEESSAKFNKDYYEDGVKKGVSCYEQYRWMPTRSFEEATDIISILHSRDLKVLDYGCAKGYLIYALRLLGIEAYGEDISEYALLNCKPEIKDWLSLPTNNKYDMIICKDVLEHIKEDEILPLFKSFNDRCEQALFIIPLADDGKFRILEYEFDKTHITKKDEEWWINKLTEAGFYINHFKYEFNNIKKKWTKNHPYGNGFFFVTAGGKNV